jgi:hypothetical protein
MAVTNSSQPGQPAQTNTPPQQGTGYVNLGSYVNANQNNQLGYTVAGGIEKAGTQATSALGAANNTFQTAATAEQNRQANLGQGVSTTLGNVTGGNYTVQPSDINTFQQALSGQSQGPTGLNNAGQLAQNAQNAQQLGQSATTAAGQYNLLQNYVGNGQQYGLGQQTLDSALLGATGASQLGQARQATANLGGQANNAINQAAAQGTSLQNGAQQLASNTQNQLGSAVQNYNQQMAANLAAAEAQTNATVAGLNGVNGNAAVNLSPAELQQLSAASGGVLGQGTDLYGLNLGNYVSANKQFANTQDIQTAQNLAQANALQQLAGSNGLTGNNAALLQSYTANPNAVGTYQSNNPFTVANQAALSQALTGQQDAYNGQMNLLNYSLNNAQNTGIGGTSPGAQMNVGNLYQAASSPTGGFGLTQAQAQQAVSANQAEQASLNQQMTQAGNQFDINRILGVAQPAAPAASATPVLGNNGQPLTVS